MIKLERNWEMNARDAYKAADQARFIAFMGLIICTAAFAVSLLALGAQR